MNKQERKKIAELEKKCRSCPCYQEYKDKNWIKDGYCIAFKTIYTHINDYTKCPYDKENEG
ncbi:hypothetical protein [Eubacterium sp.]|uniref:hypothetical protein n=1 Tax=Eubacterium sp. TaxID=142586 RepID=UPI0025F236B3|nr:hypothetical protein [Eubacterium sp.]MCR5629921.1 hypothetical protein [Eubacterium sp.]